MKDGHEEGFELGLEQGLEQGKIDGVEIGIAKTIQGMLREGLDLELISRITGKSIEQINKINEIILD